MASAGVHELTGGGLNGRGVAPPEPPRDCGSPGDPDRDAAGGPLWAWRASQTATGPWPIVLSSILVAAGALLTTLLAYHWKQPRVGYRNGHVLFYLRSGRPIATPVDVVEAFFVGQGPAMLGGREGEQLESVNLIGRISRRADHWQHVDVNPRLGQWCDGYVIMRGTWCEPLTSERVLQLNQRLHDARREKGNSSLK